MKNEILVGLRDDISPLIFSIFIWPTVANCTRRIVASRPVCFSADNTNSSLTAVEWMTKTSPPAARPRRDVM